MADQPIQPTTQTSNEAAIIIGQGTAGGTDITSALKGITLALGALVTAMGGTDAAMMSASNEGTMSRRPRR